MSENYAGDATPRISDTERQLLVRILNRLNNISGIVNGGIQGGYGNYGGGQPTFTPPAGTLGIAVDTSDGELWLWTGSWN